MYMYYHYNTYYTYLTVFVYFCRHKLEHKKVVSHKGGQWEGEIFKSRLVNGNSMFLTVAVWHVCTHVHTHKHTVRACAHTHTHTITQWAVALMLLISRAWINAYSLQPQSCSGSVRDWMRARHTTPWKEWWSWLSCESAQNTHTCTHTHTNAYIHAHTHTQTHTYTHTHTHTNH